jgi:hypothetical protein
VFAAEDAPRFDVAAAHRTITMTEDSGTYAKNNWAIAISPRPGRTNTGLAFSVVCSNSASFTMFTAPPSVTNAGMLSFTPAANAFGSTVCDVTLVDSGGVRSATKQLTVIITPGKCTDVQPANDL